MTAELITLELRSREQMAGVAGKKPRVKFRSLACVLPTGVYGEGVEDKSQRVEVLSRAGTDGAPSVRRMDSYS